MALLADKYKLFTPAKVDFNSGRELEDKGVMVMQDIVAESAPGDFIRAVRDL